MRNDAKVIDRLLGACDRLKEIAVKPNELSFPSSSVYSSVPSDGVRERLFTYINGNWKAKPKEICIRALATHGWSHLGGDTLQCVSCKQYMNVSLPPLDKLDVFKAAVRRINTQIIEGHQSTCTMRNVVTKYPTVSSADSVFYYKKILARYNSLLSLDLQSISLKLFDDENSTRLSALSLNNLNAAMLACLGWHKSCNLDDTVTCDYCKRNIGLWLFRNSKRQLNGESEHRTWCAYLETSREDGSFAWEKHLAAAVKPVARKRKLPVIVELKEKIRIFDDLLCDSVEKPNAGSC